MKHLIRSTVNILRSGCIVAALCALISGCASFGSPSEGMKVISSYTIDKPLVAQPAGTYAGYWVCSGKVAVPEPTGKTMVLVVDRLPGIRQAAPELTARAFNAIFLLDGMSADDKSCWTNHGEMHLKGCDHLGQKASSHGATFAMCDAKGTPATVPKYAAEL